MKLMAKRKRQANHARQAGRDESPATLKDRLSPEVLEKLKMQEEVLQKEEQERRQEKKKQAEASRRAEQERRENDFEFLLNHSELDWHKYK